VLTADRGILVPFRSQSALAEATLRILRDPELKRRLEHEAYAYGRETAWPRVGERMLALLRAAATHAPETDRAARTRFVTGARGV
jgi:glycosyltransferase involved in cell wall biosynthesis